ncbi:MAG: hypothetical protein KAH77_05155 [Thiomargarita sp.]|nr:hypothetical protein [Thiomargarita sp.]
MSQVEQLENAIQQRAKTLANAHLQAAHEQRDKILADSTKRLQLREKREIDIAKSAADQDYRRRVQASEIKMQAKLDQLRWHLIQSVLSEVQAQLKNQDRLSLLKQYLKNAALLFDTHDLVVRVNQQDHALLAPQWDEWIKDIVPCTLSDTIGTFTGGVLVHDKEDRIRIDNTFEGLIERLKDELYQIITAQLFASASPTRNI